MKLVFHYKWVFSYSYKFFLNRNVSVLNSVMKLELVKRRVTLTANTGTYGIYSWGKREVERE